MHKLGTDLDINGNSVKSLKLESLLVLPTLGVGDAGTIVFHSTTSSFFAWSGTGWLKLHA